MGYYIVGLIKSKTQTVEGYVLLDSANNDKISLVSKANLMANMKKDDDLVINAQVTAKGISGRYYPITNLSSIIITEKKRRLIDNGVLAVYPVDMQGNGHKLGYRCIRIRLDPLQSDLGTATRDSLLTPGVQLINKINNQIVTGYDDDLDYNSRAVTTSRTIKGVAGVEKKVADAVLEQKNKQLENDNDAKLDSMLDRLRPGLEPAGHRYTRDELLKALDDKMVNPHVDVSYDEFRLFMLLHGWTYKAKYISDDSANGIKLYCIDPKCKVLHVPSNAISLRFADTDNENKPVNVDLEFLYINNDKVVNVELPTSQGLHGSILNIGTFALGGNTKNFNQFKIGSNYVRPKEFNIGNFIINAAITRLTELRLTKVGHIDLSNITKIENCFDYTIFGTIPKLNPHTKAIIDSFRHSNILRCQDLSLLKDIESISGSFSGADVINGKLQITSSKITAITRSFNNIDSLDELDLAQCVNILHILDSFNGSRITKISLPTGDNYPLTSVDSRVDLVISSSFSSIACSEVRLPQNTVKIEDCFMYTTQDIDIDIHPYLGGYDASKRTVRNVGIKYLSGYKPNFKFKIDNFDIPYGFVSIDSDELSGRHANNEKEIERLGTMSVRDIVPRNSIFRKLALAGAEFAVFDTADFSLLDKIYGQMFGEARLRGKSCCINTVIINNNIKCIDEEAFAGITDVRNLYISPKIKNINSKAFSKHRIVSVCNVYTTSESPVCALLKNKKGFNIILVDDFNKAVEDARESMTSRVETPAKFKMMLNNNPTYRALLSPEYSANIQQIYNYLRRIEIGMDGQRLSQLPEIDTCCWAKSSDRTHYMDNDLLSVIIETQCACTQGFEDSPQAIQIFTGLNNLFTYVMGNSEPELTRKQSLEKISYFYSTKLQRPILGECSITPDDWGNYISDHNNALRELSDAISLAHGNMGDPGVISSRRKYADAYVKSPYPTSTMVDIIMGMFHSGDDRDPWEILNTSPMSKMQGLGIRFLYFDKNKNAIFTLTVNGNRIDPDNYGCRASLEQFDILIIMYKGEVVWARPLLVCKEYKDRFNTNYNNLNRYNHNCTHILQEGDLITDGETHTLGGMQLKNSIINPVILKTANSLSDNRVQNIHDMPRYAAQDTSSDTSILRLIKCALFPISGRTMSGKFYTQLFYDMFTQRFYEIESYNAGGRDESLGKHVCHKYYKSMRILRVWELNEINLIPPDYFEILQLDEKSSTKNYAESAMGTAMYVKFKLSNSEFDVNKLTSDARLYVRDNTQRGVLLSIADQLYTKLDNVQPTQKFLSVLEKAGLVASFKTKPSLFCHKTCFDTLNNISIDADTAVRELKIRDNFSVRCSPDSLIDTGHIKSASQKILIDGSASGVLFSNYIYYHDTPGRYSDKLRTFYTSLHSVDNLVKLIKLIGSSRANGVKGIGGLSNDPNKAVVATSQIVPFFSVPDLRLVYDTVQGAGINARRSSYIDPNTCIEYKLGIGIDLGDGEVYTIAVQDNKVIVLLRHDSLRAAALFLAVTMRNACWADAAYAISHGLNVSVGKEIMVLREMIIQGYNSEIPFLYDTISQLTGATTELAQSTERRFGSRLLSLLTKQMK